MKLHNNQFRLLWHLARFGLLDYPGCLELLATPELTDPVALSYAFRPLARNKYLIKHKDGSVAILAKGRALFPGLAPLITTGGGEQERKRVMQVSRMAALMEAQGFPALDELPDGAGIYFIPSACWRKIAPGILSTTRFVGMLVGCGLRLAVYDIGDGCMEWQVRAESSLFYTKYGSYETRATGMLFICQEDKREEAAKNIIRQTMWSRKQLLRDHCAERNRPTCWSRSPIKLKAQYEHVYLTTPKQIRRHMISILSEEPWIRALCEENGGRMGAGDASDIEIWPKRLTINLATDLLKYVRFFAAVKDHLKLREQCGDDAAPIRYELHIPARDMAITRMYPDVNEAEEVRFYFYQRRENPESH